MNVFSGEDVPPQETSQRRTEGCAECTVVDAECHAVHCCIECPISDGNVVLAVDRFPCLYHTGQKDGGTNIRACELVAGVTVS